jgi:hypothetical protein
MKTNCIARQIVRIRSVLSFLAVLVILAVEIGLGVSMVSRLGQTSYAQTPAQAEGMNVSLGDLPGFAK